MLLSALLGSAALTAAAPVASTCQPALKQWGQITFDGTALSVGDDGDFVIGGPNPVNFAVATCSSANYGKYEQQGQGYLVNATDATQCLTASNLDQQNATFSFQDCRYNGAGDISASQAFAYYTDYDGGNTLPAYFNGENSKAVNDTQPPIYTLKSQYDQISFQGSYGKLLADYTPNLSSTPEQYISVPYNTLPVTAPGQPDAPVLKCGTHVLGQLDWNNQTSSSNQYKGPLNAQVQADSSTTDKFIFEECDYSPSGIKAEGEVVYGRLRPGTEASGTGFQCYTFYGANIKGNSGQWIRTTQTLNCPYTTLDASDAANDSIDVIKFDKSDNSIEWVTFQKGTQTNMYYAYTAENYEEEYDVEQAGVGASNIGFVQLSPDNANLTKYPPGKLSFFADS